MAAPGMQQFLTWTFTNKCPIPEDVTNLLIEGETALHAYKTIRDCAIFTNKRLIVKDVQGLKGKKIEIYSIPYTSINMYSTENAGKMFDLNAEVELWTRAGNIKINLNRDIDIREIDRIIATAILL